jgi:hypothetical protein
MMMTNVFFFTALTTILYSLMADRPLDNLKSKQYHLAVKHIMKDFQKSGTNILKV